MLINGYAKKYDKTTNEAGVDIVEQIKELTQQSDSFEKMLGAKKLEADMLNKKISSSLGRLERLDKILRERKRKAGSLNEELGTLKSELKILDNLVLDRSRELSAIDERIRLKNYEHDYTEALLINKNMEYSDFRNEILELAIQLRGIVLKKTDNL